MITLFDFDGLQIDEGPAFGAWSYCIKFGSIWIDELVIEEFEIWRYE